MRAIAFNMTTPLVLLTAFVGLTVPLRGDEEPSAGVVRLTDGPPQEILSATGAVIGSSSGWSHDAEDQCGGYRTAYPNPFSVWLSGDHRACTYSPDHNWSRPVKHPIRRGPVEYRRYWPDKWYGEPGSAPRQAHFPVVAVPTDTTQLGYYYQRVPTWRPNPAMVPTRPWPPFWHRRECPGPMTQAPVLGPHAAELTPTPAEPTPAPASPAPDDLNKSAAR